MVDKFEAFERAETVYKTFNGTPIKAVILAPKTSISSKNCVSPLLIHFHGGGLIMGTPFDPFMLPLWFMQFAETQGAVVVSPEYRLLPEAAGSDIISDLTDFWEWIHKSLTSTISERWPGLPLNPKSVAVGGESAGGFLALQSAFLFPEAEIKLVIALYCAIDIDHPAYNPTTVELAVEEHSIVTKYLEGITPGSIRLSSPFPENGGFVEAVLKAGLHRKLIGTDRRMNLRSNLQQATKLPAIWIAEGEDDPIMPKRVVDDLVATIRSTHPQTPLLYSVQPGGHGFDVTHTLDESWVIEGVEFARKYWP